MKKLVILIVLLLAGCKDYHNPPFEVVGKYKTRSSDGEVCQLTIRPKGDRPDEFYTYFGSDYCNYNIGDLIK